MSEITYEQAASFVRGRSVAVVANSPLLLDQDGGAEIDRHQVVLRINAAIPTAAQADMAGRRTDILTAGTLRLFEEAVEKGARPRQVWWMKLTPTGTDELARLKARRHSYGIPFDLWVWPQDMESRVVERVGAPPSTGIRVLDFLQHYCEPTDISVFGFTCFGAVDDPRNTSWYRPERAMKAPHDGSRELAAFQMMRFQKRGPGWWSKSCQRNAL